MIVRFLSALPSEYENEVRALRVDVAAGEIGMKRIQEVIGDRYEHLCRNGKVSRGGQALFAGAGKHGDREKGHGGDNRGHGGSSNGGGKGGRGAGRRSKKSNASNQAPATSSPAQSADPSSGSCPSSTSSASSPPNSKPSASAGPAHRRCNVCNGTDHYMSHCPKRICAVCGGRGHWATECGTSTAMPGCRRRQRGPFGLRIISPGSWYIPR